MRSGVFFSVCAEGIPVVVNLKGLGTKGRKPPVVKYL
jgi:hypothetical protein